MKQIAERFSQKAEQVEAELAIKTQQPELQDALTKEKPAAPSRKFFPLDATLQVRICLKLVMHGRKRGQKLETAEKAKALPVSNTSSVPTKRKQGDSEPEDVVKALADVGWLLILIGAKRE